MNWLGFFSALAGGLGIVGVICLFVAIVFSAEAGVHWPWIIVGIIAFLLIVSLAFAGGLS